MRTRYRKGPTLLTSDPVTPELVRALAALAEPPVPEHLPLIEALELEGVPTRSDYARVFLFNLYPYASVYVGSEGQMGGAARGRVAGFWSALGLPVPAEPDHLSALLSLWASLAERAAESQAADPARARLLAQAADACLTEHLAPWVFAFLHAVKACDVPFYVTWASLAEAVIEGALARVLASGGPSGLPVHLHEAAEPLPDSPASGEEAFDALLAPVRSGMIVTREDLTKVARGLGLGMRVAERRYVLSGLLSQDPSGTLEGLAAHADAWRGAMRDQPWALVGEFWAGRAKHTATVLRSIAADVGTPLEWSAP